MTHTVGRESGGPPSGQPFAPVPAQPDWPRLEQEVLAWWRETDVFGQLARRNAGGPRWSFQDGPITANNPMGVHHAWGRTYKDAWQRFHAMQGFDQRWQNGFDCQGLWVEVNVERELGFRSKRDIETYGVAAFVRRCKERVLRMAAIQTEQSIRLGMWMHWDDPATLRWLGDNMDRAESVGVDTPSGRVEGTVEGLVALLGHHPWRGSYFTFSDENNYMIWRFLKACHERGWVYQGRDVMPWCGRCGTGLSQHEIATEGYQELSHLSPTVRFPLLDRPGESLLVWTTTPWTLTSNVAAAVGPDLEYVKVRSGGEVLYLAAGAVGSALPGEHETLERLPGSAMVGWRYRGPFDDLPAQAEARAAHRIIPWSEVGEAEGTGIVHIAPGCGAEDFLLGREHDLPSIAPLGEDGCFLEGFGWLVGRPALDVAEEIVADLTARGLLHRAQSHRHRYPVCWRCQSELVFRLVDEWFVSMGKHYDKPRAALSPSEKQSSLRYQMMDVVEQVRWIPSFGREREMDWLRNMSDWMISKKRYWGLALPIFRCTACTWFDVVGSREELRERAVAGWDTFDGHSPHRPYIDAVQIRCAACGAPARRIPDVGNPWLDAGIVPFSTLGYAEDRAHWERWFPADFITESFPGQFRNWFYSLLAMSTVLEGRAPFRTVLGFATLYAEDGREMHKSWGNAIQFDEAAEKMGVDVMRWMYCAHRPEVDLNFGYGPGAEVRRRFLIPLWSVVAFFVQYANVSAGWAPPSLGLHRRNGDGPSPEDAAPVAAGGAASDLDRWVLARLAVAAGRVTEALEDYDAHGATRVLEAFVEDLSNWYVRRSRRRFWEGDPAALEALYRVLVTLVRLLAPFVPFTAEAVYRNLVAGVDPEAPASVHLTWWPQLSEPDPEQARLLDDMALVMRLAALGRSARATSNVKLRQPLGKATVALRTDDEARALERLAGHLAAELNVKAIEVVRDEGTLVSHTVRPLLPKLGPRLGPRLPAVRRALAAADPAEVAACLREGRPVPLTVDGEVVTLAPDEVEVVATARAGLATAEDGAYVVGIETEITDALRAEGLARDLVRRLQQLRKDSGLDITDRIAVTLGAPAELAAAVDAWRDLVCGETLAVALEHDAAHTGMAFTAADEIGGHPVTMGLRRVEQEPPGA